MKSGQKTGFNPVHAAIIVLFTFLIYYNCLGNGFVRDDTTQILRNPWIRSFSNFPAPFKANVWAFQGKLSAYYRPVMHVAYMFTYAFSGLKPWGYHLASVLMHAANSVLVYEIAGMFTGGMGALAAGLVFAAHPLHAEAVDWAAGYPDLLAAFFSLLSFLVFARYSRRQAEGRSGYVKYLAVEFLLLMAAFLSKEPAFLMPFIFIAYDIFNAGGLKTPAGLARKYLPFPVAWAAYLTMRVYALGSLLGPSYHSGIGPGGMILNAILFFAGYIRKSFVPVRLNARYDYHLVTSALDPKFILAAVVTALFIVFLAVSFKKSRRLFFAGFFFAVPILPALYAHGLVDFLFCERYLYLSLAGFAISAGIVLEKGLQTGGRYFFTGALALLLVFYGYATFQRNTVWRNEVTLWADTFAKSPDNIVVKTQYADALRKSGRYAEAAAMYRKALAQMPYSIKIRQYLGETLMMQGDNEGAVHVLQEAVSMNSAMPGIHYDLARAYLALNNKGAAIAEYRTGLAQSPDPAACSQLASLLCRSGDKAGADALYRQAFLMDNVGGQVICR
ncbi:MAG: tetratricopeptide repeat protein [Actinomycetota bacterium]|nr:tetratricopeptide repeat protein [Actinomycetota bacterium]